MFHLPTLLVLCVCTLNNLCLLLNISWIFIWFVFRMFSIVLVFVLFKFLVSVMHY